MDIQSHGWVGVSIPVAPVKDKERPNVLFSSDIPYKIAACVAELHLFQGGTSSRVADLSKYISFFDITLELNALLSRNRSLTPSDLIKKNQIFVAKTRSLATKAYSAQSFRMFPASWRSVLEMRKPDETFVVTFRLRLQDFSIDLANPQDIRLAFQPEEGFSSLVECDNYLLTHLKSYICHTLLLELKSNSDISIHIKDSSTILQDSPIEESVSHFKDIHFSTTKDLLDCMSSSLDDSDISCVIEKQNLYDDDIEFDTSDEELRVLQSDDSGKCTVIDEDESDFSSPYCVAADEILESLSEGIHDMSTSESTKAQKPIGELGPALVAKTRKGSAELPVAFPPKSDFLEEVENLRHNNLRLPDSQSQSQSRASTIPGIVAQDSPLAVAPVRAPAMTPVVEPNDIVSPLPSPGKFQKPMLEDDAGPRTLQKKPSLLFIDHDEQHGLKYAFRDSSSSVPEYIKENKKFKFIKIGKVQKFVNMFEEQSEAPAVSVSQNGTRPSSPAK